MYLFIPTADSINQCSLRDIILMREGNPDMKACTHMGNGSEEGALFCFIMGLWGCWLIRGLVYYQSLNPIRDRPP